MYIFTNLSASRFFEEIEKYFGTYKQELRRPVFSYIASLNDFERAAMYNLVVERLPAGRGAPDISCFCKFLKEAKTEGAAIMRSIKKTEEDPEEKQRKRAEIDRWLKARAADLGLEEEDPHLMSKIFMHVMRKRTKERESK